MKKTILISIVASTVLFGADVTNLTTDQVNETKNSTINNASVDQGTTDISGSTTDVSDYARGNHNNEGPSTNIIDDVTVNGSGQATTTISQDKLSISNGSTVSNSKDHSENTIDNGTTIDAGGTDNLSITQHNINISGSTYENMEVHSTNTITNANIDGNTQINQATLLVTDANTSDGASATNVDITSTNSLTGKVADSKVKQTYIDIQAGATVSGLNIAKNNTIEGGTTEIENNSTVTQGTITISEDVPLSGLVQSTTNIMKNIKADNSTLKQDDLKISGISTDISGLDVSTKAGATHTVNANEMINIEAINAKATQMTTNIANGHITNFTSKQKNYMGDMDIVANTTVMQGDINITDSTISNLEFNLDNDMERVSMSMGSSAKQGLLVVGDSNATGTINHTDIQASNKLEDTTLNNSHVLQSSTSILGNSTVSELRHRILQGIFSRSTKH